MKFKNIKKKIYKKKLPSNSRIIPASAKASTPAKATADRSSGKPALLKLFLSKINHAFLIRAYHQALKIFVGFIFIVAAIIVGFDFQRNLQLSRKIALQRKTLTNNLAFWENFISQHQNYPDAYFQISGLEYQLGNTSRAKEYVEKGLSLDPNSPSGQKLEKFFVNK